MGKLLIIPLLVLFSCFDDYAPKPDQKYVQIHYVNYSSEGCPYQTLVIDSCEYIYVQNGNASWGAHKGTCKFCAERLKKRNPNLMEAL